MKNQNEFFELFPSSDDVLHAEKDAQEESFQSYMEDKQSESEQSDSFDVTINKEDGVIRSLDITCQGCSKKLRIILDYEHHI